MSEPRRHAITGWGAPLMDFLIGLAGVYLAYVAWTAWVAR
jgi:hypothetical protein